MSTATNYFNHLLKLKCAPKLLELKLYPNAKEVTESFGCFNATIDALGGMSVCGRKDLTCIVVGDGSTPRTAALFAFRTGWNEVISFDPQFRKEDWGIEKLTCHKGLAEDYPREYDTDLVFVFPHSHANTKKVLKAHTTEGKVTVVWLPCCTQMGLDGKSTSFVDNRIISPKNRFYVWEDLDKELINA